jgi:hypothetical protein
MCPEIISRCHVRPHRGKSATAAPGSDAARPCIEASASEEKRVLTPSVPAETLSAKIKILAVHVLAIEILQALLLIVLEL